MLNNNKLKKKIKANENETEWIKQCDKKEKKNK